MHHTDNLQSHRIGSCAFSANQTSFGNRRLAAKKLEMDFKMPWDFLAKTEVRAARFARGEVNSSSNSLMWSLYQKVRTYFKQNPE
jgi:hypothetical protein